MMHQQGCVSDGLKTPFLIICAHSFATRLGLHPRSTLYNYVGWRLVQGFGPLASGRMRDLEFEFGRVVQGVRKSLPVWQRCIGILSAVMDHPVGRLYIDNEFSPQAKEDVSWTFCYAYFGPTLSRAVDTSYIIAYATEEHNVPVKQMQNARKFWNARIQSIYPRKDSN